MRPLCPRIHSVRRSGTEHIKRSVRGQERRQVCSSKPGARVMYKLASTLDRVEIKPTPSPFALFYHAVSALRYDSRCGFLSVVSLLSCGTHFGSSCNRE